MQTKEQNNFVSMDASLRKYKKFLDNRLWSIFRGRRPPSADRLNNKVFAGQLFSLKGRAGKVAMTPEVGLVGGRPEMVNN